MTTETFSCVSDSPEASVRSMSATTVSPEVRAEWAAPATDIGMLRAVGLIFVELMLVTFYDEPDWMRDMMESLTPKDEAPPAEVEKLQAKAGSGNEPRGLELWLSSHPATGSRVQYVSEDIQFYPKREYTASTGRFPQIRQTVASLPPPKLKPAAALQAQQGRPDGGRRQAGRNQVGQQGDEQQVQARAHPIALQHDVEADRVALLRIATAAHAGADRIGPEPLARQIDIAPDFEYDHRMSETIRAPRGGQLTCKGWQQEAALRMLMNNLDPEVAEKPQELIVYGGTGKAARNWECYEAMVRSLRALEEQRRASGERGPREFSWDELFADM